MEHIINNHFLYCIWETRGGGNDVVFFGKTFENTCNSPLAFTNPDTNDLENIKRLLLIAK